MINTLRVAAIITVVVHTFLVLATAVSIPLLLWFEPWYICYPVILIIVRILYTRDGICPLNDLENYFRLKSGSDVHEGFMKYYVYRNIKKLFSKNT